MGRDREGAPHLIGGRCPDCGRDFFPRPRYCPSCLGPLEERSLGGDGVIHSFTVVRVRPPLGLPHPYAVGFVDLTESGLRVFGLLDPGRIEDLAMGSRVELRTAPLGLDNRGEPCARPFFGLAAGEGGDA
ncbi:MAG: OB-fold domain-containing protein [Desulfarculaceae bacterium]|nr:OB-fold domain-containing protein [Desulfarculaceae bacterium]